MNRPAAIVLVVIVAAAANASSQIPEQAKWEITFRQVEAAAGLSNMRDLSQQSFEARLMQRPWSASAPLPFLRVFQSEGSMRSELYVFWAPRNFPPGREPSGVGIQCRDGVCVKRIPFSVQRDWGEAVSDLALHDACPTDQMFVCGDCDQLWIKTAADGAYREQSCQQPKAETLARSLLELMQTSAQAAR